MSMWENTYPREKIMYSQATQDAIKHHGGIQECVNARRDVMPLIGAYQRRPGNLSPRDTGEMTASQ